MLLYNAVGPRFDLKPYLRFEAAWGACTGDAVRTNGQGRAVAVTEGFQKCHSITHLGPASEPLSLQNGVEGVNMAVSA